jgi:hypothetical protein
MPACLVVVTYSVLANAKHHMKLNKSINEKNSVKWL